MESRVSASGLRRVSTDDPNVQVTIKKAVKD
jgi:hypothetical protein